MEIWTFFYGLHWSQASQHATFSLIITAKWHCYQREVPAGWLIIIIRLYRSQYQSCRRVKSKEVLSAPAVTELGQKKKKNYYCTFNYSFRTKAKKHKGRNKECNDIKGDRRYVFSKTNRHSEQPFSLPPTPSTPSVTNGGSNFVIRWLWDCGLTPRSQ